MNPDNNTLLAERELLSCKYFILMLIEVLKRGYDRRRAKFFGFVIYSAG